MAADLHVVMGTGPVGTWIARTLADRGADVRAVNRSGVRPAALPADVTLVTADVSDLEQAVRAAEGAAVVYQALNPPYHQWPQLFPPLQRGALAAAKAAGARYVSIDNLYMYDPSACPISETTPLAPASSKGELRMRMAEDVLAAHARGDVEAVVLRSSDYYGPGVTASALGDRVFPAILSGKAGEILGSDSSPHSYAYIEDVAAAAAELGTRPEAVGRVWIAPHAEAATQREVLGEIFALADRPPRFTTVTPFKMRLAGIFSPGAREMVEMMYEFTQPFTVDCSAIQEAFGMQATPMRAGLERTVGWYRDEWRA